MFSSVFCSLLGFISDDYSFVVAFVIYILTWISICIFRCTFRLSIDVSASLIFLILITVPVISFLLWRVVYYGCGWPRSFCLFPPDGVHIIYNYGFHSLLIIILLSQPTSAISTYPLTLLYGWFYYIFLFVTLLPFFPLVTSLTWLRYDVHWTPTIVNCWREPYVLALGDSGQVPCGPPYLQSCLGSHLGYAVTAVRLCVTVWLSPTRCALAVPESITLASRVFCILIMLFITLRFYTSGLGLRWPSSWARLA